jgi:tetratricopeptide (TPR) repeat protein
MLLRVYAIAFLLAGALNSTAQVNIDYFMAVGGDAMSKENYRAAINSYNTVINSRPDHFRAWFFRGIAKYNLNDYLGAEKDFSRVITIHPLYAHAYHFRGLTRDKMQDYYNALRDIDKAIELDPFNADFWTSRGSVKLHMESYVWSISDFDSALSLDPGQSLAYLNRAIAKTVLKNYEGALEDCNKAVELKPYDAGVHMRRGVIKYDMKDYEGAIEDFNYSIRLNGNNAYAYFNRAMARFFVGDTVGSMDDYSQVIRLDPKNALSYYNRALLKSQLGLLKEAIEDYDNVLLINPRNIYTYYNRGVARHELGDYKGAIRDYTKAIELFPDFIGSYLNRSDARRQTGDEKGAYLDYQQAYRIMQNVNTGKLDSALMVKRYTDSTYFDKIIEFEADFITYTEDELAGYRAIDLEPGFTVQFVNDDLTYIRMNRNGYYMNRIARINETNEFGLKFALTNKSVDLSLEDAFRQINLADSLLNNDYDRAGAYFYKGIVNGMVQNYKTAIEDYDRALIMDSTLLLAYINRAMVTAEMVEHQFMQQKFASSVTITWGENEPGQADETPEKPDYTDALAFLSMAINIDPDIPFAWFNRANLKNKTRDYDGAIQDYNRAIELLDTFAEAYFNRGLTYILLDKNAQACQDLSKAGELGLESAYRVIQRYCN